MRLSSLLVALGRRTRTLVSATELKCEKVPFKARKPLALFSFPRAMEAGGKQVSMDSLQLQVARLKDEMQALKDAWVG